MGIPDYKPRSNQEIAQDLIDVFDEIYGTKTTINTITVNKKKKKNKFISLINSVLKIK
ncbi:MAG: hypothetical protein ACTSQA_03300 [Candidatus Heimdallarchaeaceae archaeon]